MTEKRITLFAGHYGSGKTNIAVNYALDLARVGRAVSLADLDVVNPYYRAKDSAEQLEAAGVRMIASPFANTNVDLPALPQEMYALTADRSRYAVVDVGGDDRGAFALGRLTPSILSEGDYNMLFVINACRPLTATPEAAMQIMREIEAASGIPFTGIVNNTNLGRETTAQTVLGSVDYANKISRASGLPVLLTSAEQSVYNNLLGKIDNLFPLTLQKTIW